MGYDTELARNRRSSDDGTGILSLDCRRGFSCDCQVVQINLARGSGTYHSQFCGLGGKILRSFEVLDLLCQILVLLVGMRRRS